MQIIYTYNKEEYRSTYQVRQAIWKNEHKVFPAEPKEESEKEAFWNALNVTITQIPDPEPSLDSVKNRKMGEIESQFNMLQNDCGFMSSVGFKVNGDETANRNVDMLIRYFPTGVETVSFCAYDNTMHDLTKEQLETILQEIVVNAQSLYQQKWVYRETINACTTAADVEAINIKFECKDFSKTE